MSQKISYALKTTDPVINGFIPNDESSYLYICDHSIVIFGIKEKCLGLSNTSHVESLYRFRDTVFDKVKTDVCIKNKNIINVFKYMNKIYKLICWKIGYGWSHNMCLSVHSRWKRQCWHRDTTIFYYAWIGIMYQGK